MNMAAPLPSPFTSQAPVPPSPDQQTFAGLLGPQLLKTFAQDVYGVTGTMARDNMRPQPPQPPQPAQLAQPYGKILEPGLEAKAAPAATTTKGHILNPADDPKYLLMASRIANYYQQRCQAIANFQQQRCQAWANMHRQKCGEMLQASLLVVAWYVRDRIKRRQKKQKRRFRRALSAEGPYAAKRAPIARGETVRRWVMAVPEKCPPQPSPPMRETLVDKDEATFDMDNRTPDDETHLYSVADNLIKSQLGRIDVPLLGATSFDESDSDSDSYSDSDADDDMGDSDEEEEEPEPDGNDGGGDDDEMDGDDDDDEYDDDDDEEEEGGGEPGSEEVNVSRKRTCISSSS